MKDLYIHVGTHKTGTSAVQRFLRTNFLEYAQKGQLGLLNNELIFSFKKKRAIDKNLAKELATDYKTQILNYEKNNVDKFLVSYEGFSGSNRDGYKDVQNIAIMLKAVAEQLSDIVNVKIIIYFRRQDDFIESIYTQQIKEGERFTFKEFLSNLKEDDFNWHKFAKHYEEQFSKENMIVKLYDKKYLPANESIIKEFCSILNIDYINKNENSKNINPGLTRDALEIKRIMNGYLDLDHEKVQLRRLLESSGTKSTFEKFSLFESQEERLEFLSRYEQSNKELSEDYFKQEQLFSEIKQYNYTPDYQLDLEKVIVIIFKILLNKDSEISNVTDNMVKLVNHLQGKNN